MADYQGKLTGAQIDALPKEIGNKQDKLLVTLLNNGNVRINFGNTLQDFMPATPSGDPMHYAYEAVGAKWNASTSHWRLLDIDDLSNDDMRRIYNVGFLKLPLYGALGNPSYANVRVNLCRLSSSNIDEASMKYFAGMNNVITSVNLTNKNNLSDINSYESVIAVKDAYQAFFGCTNLRCIYGRLELKGDVTEMFKGCSALERVRFYKLDRSISLEDSQLINVADIVDAISNAVPKAAIVITLHPAAYAAMSVDADVKAALAAQPLITLASA